ncbi:flagellar basal-body rod protein FlgF [Lacisediminimonas sp.]|uniref:flagellar basal-body rod protein FlgF n=1 Tax=Lacisediminimonas sp. TaxID=3060582 RepID=UPI00271C5104|nr:flagellar basal-body rod protein FlgF [Lacisediminimonas sp.]MDO8299552.1 flagellar basal-body rod protein FlgF [Lacisediminimonas sp.]
MLESLHAGLTGLTTFSRALGNISNNVANLNTPGFKRSQVTFQDLLYNQQQLGGNGERSGGTATGNGVGLGATNIVFTQGELRQSGNEQDAAIDGRGFFILRQEGKLFYSRAGQFEFDAQGFLTTRASGARVAVLGSGSQLQDLNIRHLLVSPPKATTAIALSGNLSVNDGDNQHVISNIGVVAGNGSTAQLSVTFTSNNNVTPRSWLVQVKDQAGAVLGEGEVQFQGDGSPAGGFEELGITFTPPGSAAQAIVLQFGRPGGFAGLTNFSAGPESTASAVPVDGIVAGSLAKTRYDEEGTVLLDYSNGQVARAGKLALAQFQFLPDLRQEGGNLFRNDTGQEPTIGTALDRGFGRIAGGSIENSNVDLTQQFSELIVTQRGYQASSQVISTANEMIQQLLDMKGRR